MFDRIRTLILLVSFTPLAFSTNPPIAKPAAHNSRKPEPRWGDIAGLDIQTKTGKHGSKQPLDHLATTRTDTGVHEDSSMLGYRGTVDAGKTLGDRATVVKILDTIEKGLAFIAKEYQNVNLDTIIGTRILEGQLTTLLERLRRERSSSVQLTWITRIIAPRINELLETSGRISDMAVGQIKVSQPLYYYRIGRLLDRNFWLFNYTSRDVGPLLRAEPKVRGEALTENQSDDCVTELFGTGPATTEKCRVSSDCWLRMTAPGYHSYSLTHEVFYLEIGKMEGCFEGPLRKHANILTEGFCANILLEAEAIADCGFLPNEQDLFAEQAALCGLLGYRQFFRPSWLDAILSWQSGSGCWAYTQHEPQKVVPRRTKREGRELADGCQCHFTTVSLAALGGYVRYAIESLLGWDGGTHYDRGGTNCDLMNV